jgi:hypothetical protein
MHRGAGFSHEGIGLGAQVLKVDIEADIQQVITNIHLRGKTMK